MVEDIVAQIKKLKEELQGIVKAAEQSRDLDLAWDRIGRWKERAVAKITELVSPDEGTKLAENKQVVFSMINPMKNFIDNARSHFSHLTALVEDIKNNPDFILGRVVATSGVSKTEEATPLDRLEKLCRRFHKVVRQLQDRYDNRPTICIDDEYDVQDLFHALLRIEFDDIRPEEWTGSYAGKSSRTDFLLKNEKVVIEIKKTGSSTTTAKLGDELLVDIDRYQHHPDCKTIVCFIYDPEGKIGNPSGLISDLEKKATSDLQLRVIVQPES